MSFAPLSVRLALAASGLVACAAAQSVQLEFESPVGHVVAPGAALEVRVRARCAEARPVRARWIRADGTQLGGPVDLRIDAPATMTLDAVERGWVGLVFDSSDRRVAFVPQPAGFPSRAYGFAVLPPPPARRADPGSPFGMVHGRSDDPYLGPHLKSLTWHTTGARWWQREVGLRRARGMIELPVVSGDGWDSDDNRPIGSSELEALSARFRSYCAADPEVLAWELGVEENLRSTFNRRHYFPNLRAKAAAVRAVARSVRPAPASPIQLVYQFEGFRLDELERLLASGALEPFDVLSAHPYRWKNFESPEDWLPDHVGRLRALLAAHGLGDRRIWFTEYGVPVRGNNDPDGFFGYPDKGRRVPGSSADQAAIYLVKSHALALAAGVERLYWYNYQNRAGDVRAAEDHFGLRAWTADGSLGDPLPAYVAYASLVMALEGLEFERLRHPTAEVWLFAFREPAGARAARARRTWLAWTHGGALGQVVVPWSALDAKLEFDHIVAVHDVYGGPLAREAKGLCVGPRPVYVLAGD